MSDLEIFNDPNASPENLSDFILEEYSDMRGSFSHREKSSHREKRARHSLDLRKALDHANTPQDVFTKILDMGEIDNVSIFISKHPRTDPKALSRRVLAGIRSLHITSYYAAQNPNLPDDIIRWILTKQISAIPEMNYSLLHNPKVPAEILEKLLSSSHDPQILNLIKYHPNLPIRTKIKSLEKNREDDLVQDLDVQEESSLGAFEDLLGSESFNLKKESELNDYSQLLNDPDSSPEDIVSYIWDTWDKQDIYGKLFSVEAPIQRVKDLLEHPNTPSSIFANVLKSNNNVIRTEFMDKILWHVARHPKTPPEALEALVMKDRTQFRATTAHYAARNPNLPQRVMENILLEKISSTAMMQYSIAQNPNLPAQVALEVLRTTENTSLKGHLVRNPNLPVRERVNYLNKYNEGEPEIVQDFDVQEEDNSLGEFGDLLSSNTFNLKKQSEDWRERGKRQAEEYRAWTEKNKFIVKDPNASPEDLGEILVNGYDESITWMAARHPNAPPEALAKVLWEDTYTAVVAAGCVNTPAEELSKLLLMEGDTDLANAIMRNPSCPVRAKLKWSQKRSKDDLENPDLQQDLDVSKKDNSLGEFGDMLSSNTFNLKKQSEDKSESLSRHESWRDDPAWHDEFYNFSTASSPDTSPEILARILDRENNDKVSVEAAANPNTPPYILAEIVDRGELNGVTQWAMSNPNCPPEALVRYLDQEEMNYISKAALRNTSCPPEALAKFAELTDDDWYLSVIANNRSCPPELLGKFLRGGDGWPLRRACENPSSSPEDLAEALERLKDDPKARFIATNPSTPLRAKIKWMEWENPSENNLVQDLDVQEDDSSLNDLGDLLGSDTLNLHKNAAIRDRAPELEIATNKESSSEDLARLIRENKFPDITQAAIGHWNVPSDVLAEVLEGGVKNLMTHVAVRHKNTTQQALINVMNNIDGDLGLRNDVAGYGNLPTDFLDELIINYDGLDYAVTVAARNEKVSPVVLEWALQEYTNPTICRSVLSNPNTPLRAKYEFMEKDKFLSGSEDFTQMLDQEPEDNSLDEFGDMLSTNKFNLKKESETEDEYDQLQRIATDYNSDPELLGQIIRDDKYESITTQAADNPNALPEALAELLDKNKYDLKTYNAAFNSNMPVEALTRALNNDKIRNELKIAVIQNKRVPQDLLLQFMLKNMYTSYGRIAVQNKHNTPEFLSAILDERYNNRVSSLAAKHPNCPLRARIEWLKATGKNGEEEVIQELDEVEEKDNSLDELSDLLSSEKFNLKKHSEDDFMEDDYRDNYYTLDNAKSNKVDPDILAKILSKGNDDYISTNAAGNPRCPPDALKDLILREIEYEENGDPDDSVITRPLLAHALSNYNTPPEILAYIVEEHGDRQYLHTPIAAWALDNPNVPAEAIGKVLREQSMGETAEYAVRHKNAPLRDKVNWLKMMTPEENKIPDLEQHLDEDVPEDTSVEDLGSLLGSNDRVVKTSDWSAPDYDEPEVLGEDPEFLAKILSRDKDDGNAFFAASNEHAPPEALRELVLRELGRASGNEIKRNVITQALLNPSLPVDVITMVVTDPKIHDILWDGTPISFWAMRNEKIPPEALGKVLREQSMSETATYAAKHEAVPLRDKVNWLKMMTPEENKTSDLEQHLDEDVPEDTSVEDLGSLLGSNDENVKTAGHKDHDDDFFIKHWYNETMARSSTDPEVLTRIVRISMESDTIRRVGNRVMNEIFKNSSLPTEALDIVVKTLHIIDDPHKYVPTALWHRNMSPKTLYDVITSEECDMHVNADTYRMADPYTIGFHALKNPNATDEAFNDLLGSDPYSETAKLAVQMKKCPPRAKLKWLSLTNSEPEIVQELDKEEEDNSLNEFKDLLGSNIFNLKKHSMSSLTDYFEEEQRNEYIRSITDDWYNNETASSLETPPSVLFDIIKVGYGSAIPYYALKNPNLPHEAIIHILDNKGKYSTILLDNAVNHLNAEPIDRKAILEKGEEDRLSWLIFYSPKTSARDKINWLKRTDQLSDESEMMIQDLDTEQQNTGLDELSDLLASSNIKTANPVTDFIDEDLPSWYNDFNARNHKTSPDILTKILEMGHDDKITQSAAYNSNTPPEALYNRLKYELLDYTAKIVTSHPNCPLDALDYAINEVPNLQVAVNAIHNENVREETISNLILAGDPNSHAAVYAAKSSKASPEDLAKILDNGHIITWVARAAAANIKTPPEALETAVLWGPTTIAEQAAKNINTPPEALIKALKRGDGMVSIYAYKNPKLPLRTKLEMLIDRDRGNGKERMIQDLDTVEEDNSMEEFGDLLSEDNSTLTKEASEDYPDWYHSRFADDPNTDPEILGKMLDLRMTDMIARLAGENPSSPPEKLAEILLEGKESSLSWAIAKNPSTPVEALIEISRRILDGNPHGNEELLIKVCQNPNLPSEVLDRVVLSENYEAAYFAAKHNKTSPEALGEVLDSGGEDTIIYEVAKNKNTPTDALVRCIESAINENANSQTAWYAQRNMNTPVRVKMKMMEHFLGSHDQDRDEISQDLDTPQDNVDLKGLGELLSENKVFNLKTANEQGEYESDLSFERERALVHDKETSSHILDRLLLTTRYKKVRERAAQHPNVSPEALAKYIEKMRNDTTSCYALRHENVPSESVAKVINVWLKNTDRMEDAVWYAISSYNCPTVSLKRVITYAPEGPELNLALMNPGVPQDFIEKFFLYKNGSKIDVFRQSVILQRNDLRPEVLEQWVRQFDEKYRSLSLLQSVVSHRNMSTEFLTEIMENPSISGVASSFAANHKNADPEALDKLARTTSRMGILRNIAKNENAKSETLLYIALNFNNEHIRDIISGNPNLSLRDKIKILSNGKEEGAYEQQLDEVKEDNSMEELGDLLSEDNSTLVKESTDKDSWYNESVAKDPNTDPEILLKIVKEYNDDGINRLALENPNCPPEAIEYILGAGEAGIANLLYRAAIHPNADMNTLAYYIKLERVIGMYALENPKLSSEFLKKLFWELEDHPIVSWRDDQLVQDHMSKMLRHPNFPMEVAVKMLEENKDTYFSRVISESPSVPARAKLLWKTRSGTLPEASIEFNQELDQEEQNTNLDDFENLLGSNTFNLKKHGGDDGQITGDWYTREIAEDKNTPPDVLTKIISMGNDDLISWMAVQNHNCPPEILHEILMRVEDNDISKFAAEHPNCPPETLSEVLTQNRGLYDYADKYAARNMNCPLKDKLEWLRNNGKIQKTDVTPDLVQHLDKQEENSSLGEFENLLSKNTFNLKRTSNKGNTSKV